MQKFCNQLIINKLSGGGATDSPTLEMTCRSFRPHLIIIVSSQQHPQQSPTVLSRMFLFSAALRHCERSVAIQTINLFSGLLHCVRKDAKRVWEQSPESLNLKSLNIKSLN